MSSQKPQIPTTVAQYWRIWAESASTTLQQITAAKLTVEDLAQPEHGTQTGQVPGTGVCAVFALSNALSGQHTLFVAPADALSLARAFTGENTADAVLSDESREAVAELFRQIAGVAADALKTKVGANVEVQFVSATVPAWTPIAQSGIRISGDPLPPVVIHMGMDADLGASIAKLSEPQDVANVSESRGADSAPKNNLDLLMDIQLEVRLRFGQREMLLRDVVELTSGAVVELDRSIEEPAELLLGGKVIARGQVVIVDGNYGLRVTEICSPRERVEYLHT